MNYFSDDRSGFGLLQVMIGTVVLGIFAMIFVRKAYNRADISLLTELVTYRDQVLDYYAAVVQSRTAWQCTVKCNSQLHTWVNKRPIDSCPLGSPCKLIIYDGDGNCQQNSCPSGATVRLPKDGWRFALEPDLGGAYNFIPPTNPSTVDSSRPMLVEATWEQAVSSPVSNAVKVTISADWKPDDGYRKNYSSFNIGKRERVIYMNRTPYKNCADGLAARHGNDERNFFDDQGTGTGVARYAGDTSIVGIDPRTGLVTCWQSPLAIPPCYRPNQLPFNRDPPSTIDIDSITTLDFVAAQRCKSDTSDKGLCPHVGSGTTGITHFDRRTGIAHCGKNHIFIKNHNNNIDCGANGSGGLVGISEGGRFICSNDSDGNDGTGVDHNESPLDDCPYGIRGWDSDGDIICANSGYNEVTTDYGANIAFHDGYWVGDKGETGCKGDNIRTCNCCEFPQHCYAGDANRRDANNRKDWLDISGACKKNCSYRNDSTIKDDFKGCQDRDCNKHGCPELSSCKTACGKYEHNGGGCLGERYGDREPIRQYNRDCETCKNNNSCSSKEHDYNECTRESCTDLDPDDDHDPCAGRCADEYRIWDECDSTCACGSPPSPTIKDCRLECNQGIHANDTDNCDHKSFTETEFPLSGTTTLSVACTRCTTYKRNCDLAKRKSREFKNERPTKIDNPTTGCSVINNRNNDYPSAKTRCS